MRLRSICCVVAVTSFVVLFSNTSQARKPIPSDEGMIVNGMLITAEDAALFAPVLLIHPGEHFLPTSIEYMLEGSDIIDTQGNVRVRHPTQLDMWSFRDPQFRLNIHPDHFAGQSPGVGNRIVAPMYVAIQVPADHSYVDLHYLFLYTYNGSQAVRVLVPFRDFNCSLDNLGEHQGDIESLTVRVSAEFDRIISVRFEAHGDSTYLAPQDVAFYAGSHPVVRAGYGSHGTFSHKGLRDEDWHKAKSFAALGFGADFVDIVSVGGPRWQPFEIGDHGQTVANGQLVFVGLDAQGVPRNDQLWAAFAGRLGGSQSNKYTGSQRIGSQALSQAQKNYANTIANLVLKAVDMGRDGDGPVGLASRDFMH